jgi:polyhydroxyalkanoate synthesis regulator protein
MTQAFGPSAFQAMEEQVRKNMSFFTDAMRMFAPFAKTPGALETKSEQPAEGAGDLETLKRQMADMQAKLDKLARK